MPAEFFGKENYPLIKSPDMVPLRMSLLREHVLGIVEAGRRAGAVVIIVPAVPNLLAPPGDSVHGPGVAASAGGPVPREGGATRGSGRRRGPAVGREQARAREVRSEAVRTSS